MILNPLQIPSFFNGFAWEKPGRNNMLKWILGGSMVVYACHDNMPKFIVKLISYRRLNKKYVDNKNGLWFLN